MAPKAFKMRLGHFIEQHAARRAEKCLLVFAQPLLDGLVVRKWRVTGVVDSVFAAFGHLTRKPSNSGSAVRSAQSMSAHSLEGAMIRLVTSRCAVALWLALSLVSFGTVSVTFCFPRGACRNVEHQRSIFPLQNGPTIVIPGHRREEGFPPQVMNMRVADRTDAEKNNRPLPSVEFDQIRMPQAL